MFGLNRAATVGLVAMVATASCKGSEPFGPGRDESLPENHPTAVGPAGSGSARPAWSENGQLAYVLPDFMTAVARPDGTGPARVLHTVTAPAQVTEVALSPDASQSYTVTIESGVSVIRWHHDGVAEVLTDHGAGADNGLKNGRRLVVAANGDVAFVARPDSLFLKRGVAAPRFVATGCRMIAAVSPSGDGVICHHPEPFSNPLRFAVDGTVATVTGSETGVTIKDVRWTAQGVHLLYSRPFAGFVAERQSDLQSKFSTPSVEYPETTGLDAVLAADGRSFVYANSYCAKTSSFIGCDHSQSILYHADLVKRTIQRVVVQTTHFNEIRISISPDGRRIAYTLGGHLYVAQVQ